MLDHERDDSRVQQDDITRLEHVNTVSTTVSQHMDGSSVEDVLPKPSNDPNDPLNWTWMEKHVTLIMVAAVAFQGAFDVASPAAGFVQQSVAFGVPVKSMLDGTGVNSIMLGVGSFIWVPLAHTYGRRPVFLFSGLVATLGALGCALSKNNGAFIGSRAVNGLGCSAGLALGGQVVKDLFFVHERGQKIGAWTVSVSMSPFIATILDGYVTTYASWRWMQWLAFFIWCFVLLASTVLLPETFYERRHHVLAVVPARKTWLQRLKFMTFDAKLTLEKFYRPFLLLKQPLIFIMGFYYGNVFGFCIFGALGILPFAFPGNYGFSAVGQGLVTIALLVGTLVGEPMSGPFSDYVVKVLARKNGGIRHAEQRLQAMWVGAILAPIGLLMFGLTLQYKVHWIAPCIAMGISAFATQSVTTVVYTYPIDCFEEQAAEVGLMINFIRQVFSFYVVFYLPQYTEKVGYGLAYGIFASLSIVLFLPVVVLMRWGGRLRERGASTKHSRDLNGDKEDIGVHAEIV